MSEKITVIHHRADFDGIFCREIARKFLPTAELIGWDYGDPKIPFPDEGKVYVLDLSPECFTLTKDLLPMRKDGGFDGTFNRLIWIDHHKSAIEKFPDHIAGYRIDGVAACRLAWQWFSAHQLAENPPLPSKEDFVTRAVSEPLAVRLAGEYDIWDKRDPDAEVFQFGLRSRELNSISWKYLLDEKGTGEFVADLLNNGRMLQAYQQRNDAGAMNQSFIVEWEGFKFLALNTQAKNSLAFSSKDVPETGHDALLKFSFNGKIWDCSMYHAKHNAGIDLSLIAVKYGGGGHRGACGMRLEKLPFFP